MSPKPIRTLIVSFLLMASACAQQRTVLFDSGWRFIRDSVVGAEAPGYNDRQWRTLHLPHDWSIENLPGTSSPFDSMAISGVSGGFTTGGTAWYRKTFTVPSSREGRRTRIQFDGVYMNADVFLNGTLLGNHPYGYTSFGYDITGALNYGGSNVLAVRVKNEGRNSRWYSGSGIYRHVWLSTFDPVHQAPWGISITTPSVNASAATVAVKARIANTGPAAPGIRFETRLLDPKGTTVQSATSNYSSEGSDTTVASQSLTVARPALWSTTSPQLYTAVTRVYLNNRLVDEVRTPFGIRTISFDAVNGFRLNGQTLKMKGGCVHHDNGPLGARAYDRAEERRVELLKQSGYNAIRCAHNPPSPAFLDACDRLGMLVINEAFDTWNERKNREDYNLYFNQWWQRDIENMIFRDGNHPSIVMWSIGNEIPRRDRPEVAAVAKMIADYVRKLDSTRPVTAGVNGIAENTDAFIGALDVAGYNYDWDLYEPDHKRLPNRVIYGSESFPLEAFDYWMAVEDNPWVIGDFVWTSFDYIGEASIGWLGYPQSRNFFPWNLAYCGDIDICGWKRPQSYYRDALWKVGQNVSIFVRPPKPTFPEWNAKLEPWSKWNWPDVVADWNWKGHEGDSLEVTLYSSCEEVDLSLNGKTLGRKKNGRTNKFLNTWKVPYQPGALQAKGFVGGRQVTTSELKTSDTPATLRLSPDRKTIRAGGQDLSYITVEVVDAKGVIDPKGEQPLRFSVEGPGTLLAVGNANPKSTEGFSGPGRNAWQGKALVIVQSTGKGAIKLTAAGAGLKPATVTIQAQ